MAGGPGFWTGFVLGGIFGAGLAMALAPRTGEETRGKIMEEAADLRSRAQEASGKVVTQASELAEQVKAAAAKAQEAAAKAREEMLSKFEAGRGFEEPLSGT